MRRLRQSLAVALRPAERPQAPHLVAIPQERGAVTRGSLRVARHLPRAIQRHSVTVGAAQRAQIL